MAEKNIFAYKPFLSLNISDFNIFFCENCNPPEKKVTPYFPATSPLKVEVLSSPPFLKIWLEVQPPKAAARGSGGACIMYQIKIESVSN